MALADSFTISSSESGMIKSSVVSLGVERGVVASVDVSVEELSVLMERRLLCLSTAPPTCGGLGEEGEKAPVNDAQVDARSRLRLKRESFMILTVTFNNRVDSAHYGVCGKEERRGEREERRKEKNADDEKNRVLVADVCAY